uniref:Probable G-protein coupled receptor 83-like n=1 Tax=Saccoglossus kowalevskii TaxID=10224 RepID=A0ABM0M3F9_SACKO|nr:PREDICTED: probable G-protein coupled receptor 83-like [Saccoglossus kowalevskii]
MDQHDIVVDESDYYDCICFQRNCPDIVWNSTYMYLYEYSANSSYYEDNFNELFCPNTDLSKTEKAILMIIYVLTIVLTLIGNIIVICVLTFGNRVKSELNKYLINLAVADISMALFCMPFTFMSAVMHEWVFGDVMCPVVFFIQQLTNQCPCILHYDDLKSATREVEVSASVSIFTLTAIGADRYIVVMRPLRLRVSKSRSSVVLVMIWTISMSLAMVELATVRTKASNNGTLIQCDEWWEHPRDPIIYEIFVFTVAYVIPSCILWYSYQRVAYILWQRSLPGNPQQARDLVHLQKKIKVIRMLIIVVLAFGLCWLPINIFNIVTSIKREYLTSSYYRRNVLRVFFCVHWFAMANSFLNPLIYTCLHEGFRAALEVTLKYDMKFVMENLNAKVGNDKTEHERSMEKEGCGTMNENVDVKVKQEADIRSDHHLVIAVLKVKLRKPGNKKTGRQQFDVG